MKKKYIISAFLIIVLCIQLFTINTYATGSSAEVSTAIDSASDASDLNNTGKGSETEISGADNSGEEASVQEDIASDSDEEESAENSNKPTTDSFKDATEAVLEINVLFIDDNEVRHMVTCGVGFLIQTQEGDQYVVSTKDIVSPSKKTREAVYKQLGISNEDDAWDKIDLQIEVAYEGDVATSASVAYSSKEMNLALLKLEDKVYNRTPLTLLVDDDEQSDYRPFKEADDVYALGFPNMSKILDDAIDYFSSKDVVTLSGKITNVTEKNSSEVILHTVTMQSSMYGGPLVNDHGLLIGMNTLDMEGNYYISISSNSIMKVLKAVGLDTVDYMTATEYDEYLNPPEEVEEEPDDPVETVIEPVIPRKIFILIFVLIGIILIVLIALIVVVVRNSKPRKKSKRQLLKEKEDEIMSGNRFEDQDMDSETEKPVASNELKVSSQELPKTPSARLDENSTGKTRYSEKISEAAGETTVLNTDMNVVPNSYAIGTLICKSTGENIVIDKPVYRIGKNENYNDYCIRNNTAVSRMHAEIHATMQGAVIIDVGSTNGTFVSGNRIPQGQQIPLHPGNVIRLGDEEFEFRN